MVRVSWCGENGNREPAQTHSANKQGTKMCARKKTGSSRLEWRNGRNAALIATIMPIQIAQPSAIASQDGRASQLPLGHVAMPSETSVVVVEVPIRAATTTKAASTRNDIRSGLRFMALVDCPRRRRGRGRGYPWRCRFRSGLRCEGDRHRQCRRTCHIRKAGERLCARSKDQRRESVSQ